MTDTVSDPLDRVQLFGSANTNTFLPGPNASRRALEITRDGALFTAGFTLKAALMGRVFHVNVGTVTTPVTFLTTAANRPVWVIRVPSGTSILPVKIEHVLEAAAGTATELDIRIAQNDIGNGTSSAADVGPINARTDAPYTSLCTARKLYTGDATAETNPVSVHRQTWPLAQATGLIPYADYWKPEPGEAIVVGPGSLEALLAATTTQATGYVQITYVEVPSTWVTG